MSRYEFAHRDERWTVGWDPQQQTHYAQVHPEPGRDGTHGAPSQALVHAARDVVASVSSQSWTAAGEAMEVLRVQMEAHDATTYSGHDVELVAAARTFTRADVSAEHTTDSTLQAASRRLEHALPGAPAGDEPGIDGTLVPVFGNSQNPTPTLVDLMEDLATGIEPPVVVPAQIREQLAADDAARAAAGVRLEGGAPAVEPGALPLAGHRAVERNDRRAERSTAAAWGGQDGGMSGPAPGAPGAGIPAGVSTTPAEREDAGRLARWTQLLRGAPTAAAEAVRGAVSSPGGKGEGGVQAPTAAARSDRQASRGGHRVEERRQEEGLRPERGRGPRM